MTLYQEYGGETEEFTLELLENLLEQQDDIRRKMEQDSFRHL